MRSYGPHCPSALNLRTLFVQNRSRNITARTDFARRRAGRLSVRRLLALLLTAAVLAGAWAPGMTVRTADACGAPGGSGDHEVAFLSEIEASPDTMKKRKVRSDTTRRRQVSESTTADTTREKRWQDDVWNQIVRVQGVDIAYLYYREADTVNDGVVIRLANSSDCLVRISFTVVFRSSTREVAVDEAYTLGPGERKTGSNDGLYWIPFQDGESIAEVGLRGLRVDVDAPGSHAATCNGS